MKTIMNKMMLSCNQATLLMEKKTDVGLTLTEKLKIRFHTSMCSGCTNYQTQTQLINELLKNHFTSRSTNTISNLDVQKLKANILDLLKK